jgi:Fur family peroxide stress response transcriptional regulator
MRQGDIHGKLKKAGLKVTPQRHAVLEAVYELGNHPTVEQIQTYIRSSHPNVATGTVYNVLEVFIEKGLIRRVKTERDAMRYDSIMKNHHHLYCVESDRIEDYLDEELDALLREYFRKKGIRDFDIDNITLQIKGNFTNR